MLSTLSSTVFPSLYHFSLLFLWFFVFSHSSNIHCVPLKNLFLFSSSFPRGKSLVCIRSEFVLPFLPSILLSPFLQFPALSAVYLCPQPVSVQLEEIAGKRSMCLFLSLWLLHEKWLPTPGLMGKVLCLVCGLR